jgi:hypothetical protein
MTAGELDLQALAGHATPTGGHAAIARPGGGVPQAIA